MLALIDGDILCYRCGAACENADVGIAKWQIDQTTTRIVEEVNASDWKVFLSGDNNFRYGLYPEYKANRKDMRRPKWLEALREHMVLEWNAQIADGYEADDAIGIAVSEATEVLDTVVCSIDKDLRQLPGNHYHFVNRTWLTVSDLEGWRNFYYQLLVGDATDNIKGCEGIGPVKAERILRGCDSAHGFYVACVEAYFDRYKEQWEEKLKLNANLLYVLRKENDSWQPPLDYKPRKQEQAPKPSSSGELVSTSTVDTSQTTDTSLSDGPQTVNSTTT